MSYEPAYWQTGYELRMQCGCTFSDTTLYQVSSIKYQVSSIKHQVRPAHFHILIFSNLHINPSYQYLLQVYSSSSKIHLKFLLRIQLVLAARVLERYRYP